MPPELRSPRNKTWRIITIFKVTKVHVRFFYPYKIEDKYGNLQQPAQSRPPGKGDVID